MKLKLLLVLVGMGTMLACGSGGGGESPGVEPTLSAIAVAPVTPILELGSTQQFTATGTYSDNRTQDLTSSVTWSTSSPVTATIDHAGLAAALAAGTATIAAELNGVAGRATLTVRDRILESPFGFNPPRVAHPGYSNNGYNDAQAIGVTWARMSTYLFWFLVQPDLSSTALDFSTYDRNFAAVPSGMRILANIAPQGNIDEGYGRAGSYLPVDEGKFLAFVKAAVGRYSGAASAAAGLASPIKYWQVGNEPNNSKSGFAELQKITYIAIKEVCPDCTVVIGGVPGMPPASHYLATFDQQFKPFLDTLAGQYVDVLDFHWYGNATGDYLGAKPVYDHLRAVLDADGFTQTPIWITEMGSYSGDPLPNPPVMPYDYPLQSEQQQALDYLKRYVYSLALGVKKIFPAFGMMEGFKYDGGYFDFTGIIYDGWDPAGTTPSDLGLGVKKLGYYTYRKMTEILEGSDWNNIETIQAADNVYIFKFTRNNAPIYVAWWDYFAEPAFAPGKTKTVVLPGVVGDAVLVTEAVPKFATGKEVGDYATAFTSQTVATVNGTVSLTLHENPVYVEKVQ